MEKREISTKSDEKIIRLFEKKFSESLEKCAVNLASSIAAGVSGGADSIAMLTALLHCAPNAKLSVITVNHNIRSEAESSGDAAFVADFCAKHGVFCKTVEIPRGEIERTAKILDGGTEDAARALRYKAFEEFSKEVGADFFCLAHNRNDQLETLVMRFLQGSAGEAVAGISQVRGKYVRPLIDVSRSEIEAYLRAQGICWRTDSTNADTAYLRNRVRKFVLPMFDQLFVGWDGAAISGAKKMRDDAEFVEESFSSYLSKMRSCKEYHSVDFPSFCAAPRAFRRRIVYSLSSKVRSGVRLPSVVVETVCSWAELGKQNAKIEASGITVFIWNNFLCADTIKNSFSDCGFCATIEKSGTVIFPHFSIEICAEDGGILLKNGVEQVFLPDLAYPFLLRSAQPLDRIRDADGKFREISKIFGSWKIPESERWKIPVVQELLLAETKIVAILGGFFSAKNWIVRNWMN